MQKTSNPAQLKNQSVFGLLVREEFLRRCKNNPAYSLRAFARQLGVDPSLLSKILRGKRPASPELIKAIGPSIGLTPRRLANFLKGQDDVVYNQVSEDIFDVISDWFHFAILELMKTNGFISDSKWIAKRLAIHKTEVEAALERLARLDFIESKDGKWLVKSQNNTWANNEMTSAARKNLQKQLALKAVSAIEHLPFDLRESGSLTIACSRELLPEIKKKIQSFRRELDQFIEAHEKPDEVYQLVVSFYPLTNVYEKAGEMK